MSSLSSACCSFILKRLGAEHTPCLFLLSLMSNVLPSRIYSAVLFILFALFCGMTATGCYYGFTFSYRYRMHRHLNDRLGAKRGFAIEPRNDSNTLRKGVGARGLGRSDDWATIVLFSKSQDSGICMEFGTSGGQDRYISLTRWIRRCCRVVIIIFSQKSASLGSRVGENTAAPFSVATRTNSDDSSLKSRS